jgi:NAD(P)-dependent dehydrogenase (short-subunit alcohol dehydrogenase family)
MAVEPTDLAPESEGTAPGRGRLEGRRVLVVGAGTRRVEGKEGAVGNGRAISILAAREGASVACADVDGEAAAETLAGVEGEGGTGCVLVADVGDPDACTRLPGNAAQALGGLDGVVLSVGVLGPFDLAGTAAEEWDRVFAVNARSHGLIAGAALELMPPGSSLVFMSSMSGLMPGIGMPAYDATKAAVLAIARHAALEGAARGIRANAVLPGVVDTPLGAATLRPDGPPRDRLRIPLGRRGTPWDVAYATLFLLSGESAYVTGQSLVVDGGITTLVLGG